MRGGWNYFRKISMDRLVLTKVSDSVIRKNVVWMHYLWTSNFFCSCTAKVGNICKIWGSQSSGVDEDPYLLRSNVWSVNRYPSLDTSKWSSKLLQNIANLCQLTKSHVPEDMNRENLFLFIVVIRNEVSLNCCFIIILLYFHLTARWYKKLKRRWVASIWARTSSTSSENHEAFCFATVETWSPKRSAYKNRCHTSLSPWAYPTGEVWWPHSNLLTAGLTSGN